MAKGPPHEEELDGVGDYIDDLARALAQARPIWEHDDLFKEPPTEDED